MTPTITPPRGMRDFLPREKARREHALAVIRERFAAHGFDEIETPVVEDISRLHSGLGGDNEKLSFSILRRGLSVDDVSEAVAADDLLALCDLGLRFDLTVPLARFYATHRSELPGVFRTIQIAPVWRAERPQKGRYRQFVQCDIDIIGESSSLAEAELITATADALVALGLENCTIRVNDRRVLNSILAYCGFAPDRWSQVLVSLDKLDKIGSSGVVAELAEFGSDAADVVGGILDEFEKRRDAGGVPLTVEAIAGVLPAGLVTSGVNAAGAESDAVADLEMLARSLMHLPKGIRVAFDPTLVRGQGYYTGTIFEIDVPGSTSAVGGGGRYDGMIGRFSGTDVPACGFSIGFERVVDLCVLPDDDDPDAVVLVYEPSIADSALLAVKAELVAQGHRVRVERRVKNLKSLLERLRESGFDVFAFVDSTTASARDLQFKSLV